MSIVRDYIPSQPPCIIAWRFFSLRPVRGTLLAAFSSYVVHCQACHAGIKICTGRNGISGINYLIIPVFCHFCHFCHVFFLYSILCPFHTKIYLRTPPALRRRIVLLAALSSSGFLLIIKICTVSFVSFVSFHCILFNLFNWWTDQ